MSLGFEGHRRRWPQKLHTTQVKKPGRKDKKKKTAKAPAKASFRRGAKKGKRLSVGSFTTVPSRLGTQSLGLVEGQVYFLVFALRKKGLIAAAALY